MDIKNSSVNNYADTNKNIYYASLFLKISEIASIIVLSIGLIVFAELLFKSYNLKLLCCKHDMMRVNAALAFILTGISLWSSQNSGLSNLKKNFL
ncbi:MAG: hypothetical protein H7844_11705 [Nitrospirae bacterium YQR-1]